jgi:arsenite oxidase small subunit
MNNISRRNFLSIVKQLLAASGLAAIAAPVVAYFYPSNLEETPSEAVDAGPMQDLPVNEAITVKFGRYPALVINTPDGLKAYSSVCTHFACLVKWEKETGKIVCPCHDATFDPKDGSVLGGPAPSPLTAFNVEVRDGNIFIGGAS